MRNDVMLTWIIPVYNGEKYLAQAIDSILRQPCGDFEILVIDDGSTDSSLQIARSYTDSRVKAIHKENGGVSSARNLGIENAKSRYIAFLDADDVICKNAYDYKINHILETEQYDLLSLSLYYGDQDLKWANRRAETDRIIDCAASQLDEFKHCSSFIYHRSLFQGDDAVRFPEGMKVREDVSFQFLVHWKAKNVLGISTDWFVYRNNSTSVMHGWKKPDYLIRYAIPAWNWAKKRCKENAAKKICDTKIFAEVAEYIRLSCMAGTPVEEIQRDLQDPVIQEIFCNYDIFWNSSKVIYESFSGQPQKYWFRQRAKGVFVGMMRMFAQVPMARQLYFRKKYRENIEVLV